MWHRCDAAWHSSAGSIHHLEPSRSIDVIDISENNKFLKHCRSVAWMPIVTGWSEKRNQSTVDLSFFCLICFSEITKQVINVDFFRFDLNLFISPLLKFYNVCVYIFNSVQVSLYSAFYDTIVAKQLHRKLSFHNIYIYTVYIHTYTLKFSWNAFIWDNLMEKSFVTLYILKFFDKSLIIKKCKSIFLQ